MESFNSVIKNELSFNKMIETQVAQLASALPSPIAGKLSGQPEVPTKENVSAVTTQTGKSTRDPLHPNHAGKQQEKTPEKEVEVPDDDIPVMEDSPEEEAQPEKAAADFHDTTALPFPSHQ